VKLRISQNNIVFPLISLQGLGHEVLLQAKVKSSWLLCRVLWQKFKEVSEVMLPPSSGQ
jgi:hypothetical protein